MPLELAALANRLARVSVPFGDAGTVEVDYRPHLLTGDLQMRVVNAAVAANFEPFYREMSGLIIWWDVTRDGLAVPTTPEGLASVGIEVVRKVWGAISEDASAPKATRTMPTTAGSSNGSSQADSAATPSPTTSTSSSAPNGPASLHGLSPDSTTPLTASAGGPGSAVSGEPSTAPTASA